MCVGLCVAAICSTGHESKLHENINTFDQKSIIDLSSSCGFEGIFKALMHMWEMPRTAVMRRGKVGEIKRVPFKKK